jgi:hypothetical protein
LSGEKEDLTKPGVRRALPKTVEFDYQAAFYLDEEKLKGKWPAYADSVPWEVAK